MSVAGFLRAVALFLEIIKGLFEGADCNVCLTVIVFFEIYSLPLSIGLAVWLCWLVHQFNSLQGLVFRSSLRFVYCNFLFCFYQII
jgi:hypothetical protein